MKLLVLLTFVALARSNESDDIKLAADNPQLLNNLFTRFRSDNFRVYSSPAEGRTRMGIFRKFVKEAAKINADDSDLEVGITFFADLTEEEKMGYHGANITAEVGEDIPQFEPEGLQWGSSSVSHKARYGGVKNQGQCGSCWAFGAVGVTEGYNSMYTGRYTSFSEQQVLDCSNAGSCSGGYHIRALNYIKNRNYLATASNYRYRTRKGSCQNRGNSLGIRVTGIWQARGDSRLAGAIQRGPVAVLLYNFHGVGIEGYKSGTIQPENHGPRAMNHIVVAVGYTSSNWELRNSWGSWWGQQGYFWHSRRTNNNIGVSDYAYSMNVQRNNGQEEIEE